MVFSHFLQDSGVEPMWILFAAVGIGFVSYLLGCFNGSAVISKYVLRDDVRKHGSGNAGLTNFYRTFGGPLTIAVIASDVIKAILALLFATFIASQMSPELVVPAKYWAGTFCLLGHMFPFTFQFRGGKGILSGGTIIILMDWRIALIAWVIFMVLAVGTRYVSLGSITAAATFPFTTWLTYQDFFVTVLAFFLAGLVIWKHWGNVIRLLEGRESKFTLHRNKTEAPQSQSQPQPEAESQGSQEAADAEENEAESEKDGSQLPSDPEDAPQADDNAKEPESKPAEKKQQQAAGKNSRAAADSASAGDGKQAQAQAQAEKKQSKNKSRKSKSKSKGKRNSGAGGKA